MSQRPQSLPPSLSHMATEALAMDATYHQHTPPTPNHRHFNPDHGNSSTPVTASDSASPIDLVENGDAEESQSSGETSDGADDEDEDDSEKEAVVAPSVQGQTDQAGLKSEYRDMGDLALNEGDLDMYIKNEEDDDDDAYDAVDDIPEDDLPYEAFVGDASSEYFVLWDGSLKPYAEAQRQDTYTFLPRDYDTPDDLPDVFPSRLSPRILSPPPSTPTTADQYGEPGSFNLSSQRQRSLSGIDPSSINPSQCRGTGFWINEPCPAMSGYNSDGETTDEDVPPPTAAKNIRDLLHRSISKQDISTPSARRRNRHSTKALRRLEPHLGTFKLDWSQVIVMPYQRSNDLDFRVPSHKILPPESIGLFGMSPGVTACICHPDKHVGLSQELLTQPSVERAIEMADPTIGNGTDAAMNDMMEVLISSDNGPDNGLEFGPLFLPPPVPDPAPDFVPANSSMLRELRFNEPNSDQESDDVLDLEDIFYLDDDSSDSDGEGQCLKLRGARDLDRGTGDVEQSQSRGPSRLSNSGFAFTKPHTRSTHDGVSKKRKASDSPNGPTRASTRQRR